MKMTVVTIALCTALASLCAVPVPVDVTAETLAKIKGNTACAVAYPTSGGCTACIPRSLSEYPAFAWKFLMECGKDHSRVQIIFFQVRLSGI